jgi:hypothetical protein
MSDPYTKEIKNTENTSVFFRSFLMIDKSIVDNTEFYNELLKEVRNYESMHTFKTQLMFQSYMSNPNPITMVNIKDNNLSEFMSEELKKRKERIIYMFDNRKNGNGLKYYDVIVQNN